MLIINAICGVLGMMFVAIYWLSGAFKSLRVLAATFFLIALYFSVTYGMAAMGFVESVSVSIFLRPLTGPLLLLAGLPFLVLTFLRRKD